MSVVNIIHDDSAIHMFTDAGVWGNDCKIREFRHKGYILPHLHSVISSRGDGRLFEYISQRISTTCGSFDEFILLLSAICRDEYFRYCEYGIDLELWVCGYSSRMREVQAYGLCNEGLTIDDHGFVAKPWELARVKDNLYLPYYGSAENRPSFKTGPIVENAIALAERQRRIPVKGPGGRDVYSVGGFIQQTTVTDLGVFSRVIHRWPDKVGQEILPFSSN